MLFVTFFFLIMQERFSFYFSLIQGLCFAVFLFWVLFFLVVAVVVCFQCVELYCTCSLSGFARTEIRAFFFVLVIFNRTDSSSYTEASN